ncbi:MAG TPA: YggT family protein [Spirochaetia bacterium]|nr:YggT family protein [Spirochaetia bacterium]
MLVAMRIVSAVIMVYMILIFVRVLLTWFQGPSMGRPFAILASVTDPYLNWFRRFRFLQTQRIDFSPIVALIVLVILLNITNTIASFGTITVGIVLALILAALWSAISFILTFLVILDGVRLVGDLLNVNSVNAFWHTLDIILSPILNWTVRVVLRSRPVTYRAAMLITGVLLLIVIFGGKYLVRELVILAQMLPF